jgi:23S rRNA (adenine2503-C2)-methyltransferase
MDIKVYNGKNSNIFKYVFVDKNWVAEAVLYRYPTFIERTVICCSVMSGCPVGCVFCGTGKKFIRNLNDKEIVFQVRHVIKAKNINPDEVKRFQIMFMSMGEPMLNWINTKKALIKLHHLYPRAELLISTIGIENEMVKNELIEISKKIRKVGIQFSIHEFNNARRDKIIPFNDKMSLEQIAEFGNKWYQQTGRKPFLNYIVTTDNWGEIAAKNLAEVFNPKIFKLTLSVLCGTKKTKNLNTDTQLKVIASFKKLMEGEGFNVRVFNPAGQDDIGGGCGQLWFVQKLLRKNND